MEENEWIEWGGWECPVAGDARVSVKLRDGAIFHDDDRVDRADGWNWKRTGGRNDIMAYRLYTGPVS